ncbi:MAG: DUF4968 domain-containing protein [candidate division KSB1 bacterium]|nr:DUF4968 domain-containing protein [candidate division KSB1 bacterium]
MRRMLAALLLSSAALCAFERQSDGVLISIDSPGSDAPKRVKVQVIKENIFRVVATPTDTFSTRPSLMIEKKQFPPTRFMVSESVQKIRIKTAAAAAEIDKKNGRVEFFDRTGKSWLREAENGRHITPAEVMGEQTFHVQQLWESPDDEAVYGLGQHQFDWMNYKGKDLDLYQLNIIAVVPFLVSSRNYGILWDNNSRSKFGDPDEYLPIDRLNLYDSEGKLGGLTVEYFADEVFSKPLLKQVERTISHANLEEWDNYPPGFDKNRGSIRWSGFLEAPESGVYNLRFFSSNYAKLWLNKELVVDSWRQNWMPWARMVRTTLRKGDKVPIRIEWVPNGGYIGLTFKGPRKAIYDRTLSLFSEVADQLDYYFIGGRNLDEVIAGYRYLTGKAPMMPKWAMGFWQCRQRYQSQEELLGVVEEFRRRGIPLDVIVQDWFYWPEDKWGDHEFDPTRFPDPEGMVRRLHDELHARIMISVWPKFYVGTKNYEV